MQQIKSLLGIVAKQNPKAFLKALGHIDVSTNLRSALLRLRPPEPLLKRAIPILLSKLPPSQEYFLWDYPIEIPPFIGVQALTYSPSGIEIQKDGVLFFCIHF